MESADNGIQIIKKNVAKVTKYVLVYPRYLLVPRGTPAVIFAIIRQFYCIICCSTVFHQVNLCSFSHLSDPGNLMLVSIFP